MKVFRVFFFGKYVGKLRAEKLVIFEVFLREILDIKWDVFRRWNWGFLSEETEEFLDEEIGGFLTVETGVPGRGN
jgi:hypothetical protein